MKLRRMKWSSILAMAMVLALILSNAPQAVMAATVPIDTFETTNLTAALQSSAITGTVTAVDSPVAEAIGGVRDLSLTYQSGSFTVRLGIDTLTQQLAFGSDPSTRGDFTIRWDGNAANNTPNLNTRIDDGGVNDGFLILITADQAGWSMQLDVRDQADTTTASYSYTENDDIRGSGRVYFIPFSDFTNAAVLNGIVGAIDLTIFGVNDLDLTVEFIQTIDLTDNPIDFGDLPAVYGMTTLAENGAGHTNFGTTIRMGPLVDGESDGQTSANADGDDLLNEADEDGVTFTGNWSDGTGELDVEIVGSVNGCLSAWLDWNSGSPVFNPNGSFNDLLENIINNQPVTPGTNSFSFPLFGFDSTVTMFSRFRVVPDRGAGGCSDQVGPGLTGLLNDGEVEDYQITFRPTAITLTNIEAKNYTPMTITAAVVLLLFASGGALLIYKRRRA